MTMGRFFAFIPTTQGSFITHLIAKPKILRSGIIQRGKGTHQILGSHSHKGREVCWLLLLGLLFATGLGACKLHQVSLSFETIEQKERTGTSEGYEAKEPFLVIVAQPHDLAGLDDWISKDASAQLQELDFDAYFGLAAFLGRKGTSGYGIQIERITRLDDQVEVFVKIREPQPKEKKNDVETSPYHLVQVHKTGVWAQDVVFKMLADSDMLSLTAHYVP
ncbi:MAG: protease complex subunit PrcB family protein [Anaerolineae bacterium]